MKLKTYCLKCNNMGFTLIELVIALLILSILSVTIFPRFLTNSNLTEFTYRSEIIAKLRLIQTRAMQQTNISADYCHRLLVSSKQLGVPRGDCDDSPTFLSSWLPEGTDVIVESNDEIVLSTNAIDNNFTFDSMGRPNNCNAELCSITVTGEQSLTILIESEGYIHAG